MAEIVGRANVEPCSVDRVVDHFAPVGNEHLYEVGCVKDSVVGDAVEQRAPHDVDSRVGVVVVSKGLWISQVLSSYTNIIVLIM